MAKDQKSILSQIRTYAWTILICAMVVVPLGVWAYQELSVRLEPEKNPMRAVGIAPNMVFNREFSLINQNGDRVSGDKYNSRAWAVFFGFTHCPDVCPLTLSRLSGLWPQIKNQERIQLFFVSVDPERDTPDVLKDYMKSFDPSFLALTGETVLIEEIKKNFHVYSKKVQERGDPNYSVDHTATVYLLRADGTFAGTIDGDEPDATVVGKLKNLTGG
jgi:protein SCO1/2